MAIYREFQTLMQFFQSAAHDAQLLDVEIDEVDMFFGPRGRELLCGPAPLTDEQLDEMFLISFAAHRSGALEAAEQALHARIRAILMGGVLMAEHVLRVKELRSLMNFVDQTLIQKKI